MEATTHRVPGAHDLQLRLLEWSEEGIPLLMLHGFGNEAHIWDAFAPHMAPHYHTLALDQRGHGHSDAVAGQHPHPPPRPPLMKGGF